VFMNPVATFISIPAAKEFSGEYAKYATKIRTMPIMSVRKQSKVIRSSFISSI